MNVNYLGKRRGQNGKTCPTLWKQHVQKPWGRRGLTEGLCDWGIERKGVVGGQRQTVVRPFGV